MPRSLPAFFLIVAVVVFSLLGLRRLSFATDVLQVLPDDIPEAEALKAFRKYFDDDNRVVLLLRHDEEVFEEDAEALAARLEQALPGAMVRYRDRVEDDGEGFALSLARLWADADPAEVAEFASRLEDPAELDQILQDAKDKIALSLDQGEATKKAYDPLGFLQHPALVQLEGSEFTFQSDDGKLWLLLISNADLGLEYRRHADWVAQIREVAEEWCEEGFSYRLTGGPVFSSEVGRGMEKDMAGTMTLTCLAVALLFLLIQRSPMQLAVLGGIVAIVFTITFGFAGWIYGTLNLVSVGFAAILLGLVIDYGVVIARESSAGQGAAALRREMAPGILWAAMTTAVVFGVLMLSTFKGVQQLGGLVLIGLVAGAVVCLWIMPMALQRFPRKAASSLLAPPFPSPKQAVVGLAVLVGAALCAFVVKGPPQIEFDLAMVEPEASEAAQTLEVLQESFPNWSQQNLTVMAKGGSLAEVRESLGDSANEIARLKEEGVVVRSDWPVALLPDREARSVNAALWEKIAGQSERILAQMKAAGFNERGCFLDARVLENLATPPTELDDLTRSFYHEEGYFSGRIEVARPVDESTLVELAQLNDNGVTVSGWAMLKTVLLERVEKDLYFLFIPATLVLLVALVLVFRSWKDALLTSGVLVVVLLLVNALSVVTGQPWNFLSSMAIPLIVGTGIDYSIHLIFSLRRSGGDLAQVWNGVGKGILFCGLSTVVGFGSLAFASNETLQSMGIFCSAGVFCTMTLSVLVVPCLWSPLREAEQEAGNREQT